MRNAFRTLGVFLGPRRFTRMIILMSQKRLDVLCFDMPASMRNKRWRFHSSCLHLGPVISRMVQITKAALKHKKHLEVEYSPKQRENK